MTLMCRVLKVSTSGYYAWAKRPAKSPHEIRDAELLDDIRRLHANSRGTYGSPRIHAALTLEGAHVSKKRIARLMRHDGLRGKIRKRFVHTTDSEHEHPIAPNTLDRQFSPDSVKPAWVGDITYLRTESGWAYLAVIIDLRSRMVVGWELASHMQTELVEAALLHAVGSQAFEKGLIHHTDRGSQYASNDYRGLLDDLDIQVSMSRKGNCWDNAVAESFFGTLKQELAFHRSWAGLADARADIHDYIEVFYNRQRLHSSLGYKTPAAVNKAAA